MSGLIARLRPILASLRGFGQGSIAKATSWRSRRADARARAICPVDSWTFTPLYSNGRCPLCGWVPGGYVYRPPLLATYDRYWGNLGGVATTSVIMFIVVLIAYNQG